VSISLLAQLAGGAMVLLSRRALQERFAGRKADTGAGEGIDLGCRVCVLGGRHFPSFREGDEGQVVRIDREALNCDVLFHGAEQPVPVALRHLRHVPVDAEGSSTMTLAHLQEPQSVASTSAAMAAALRSQSSMVGLQSVAQPASEPHWCEVLPVSIDGLRHDTPPGRTRIVQQQQAECKDSEQMMLGSLEGCGAASCASPFADATPDGAGSCTPGPDLRSAATLADVSMILLNSELHAAAEQQPTSREGSGIGGQALDGGCRQRAEISRLQVELEAAITFARRRTPGCIVSSSPAFG